MKLENAITSDLLGKNLQKAKEAAKLIINTPDLEAWKCLLENSEFIFSYIKDKAGKLLSEEITSDNVEKVMQLFEMHEGEWDEYLATGLARVANDSLNEKMLDLLQNGTLEEKTYASAYFCLVQYNDAAQPLFDCSSSYCQKLKTNAAEALGKLNHEESYNHYIERLKSEDEWDRIEAAQFLAKFGRKDAVLPILQSMESSAMAELIAGEIATLINIYDLFEDKDEKTKSLALEALDNIIQGIPEIWCLGVVLDFKIFECLQKLIQMAKTPDNSGFAGRYAQILYRAKLKFTMFVNNSQYTYDEEKDILAELDEIYHLLAFEDESFWKAQLDVLIKELELEDKKRKLAAISIINELASEQSVPALVKIASDENEDEVVICEAVAALAKMGKASGLNKEELFGRIKDPNLLAMVKNSFYSVDVPDGEELYK